MKITKNERKGNTVALEVQADYSEFKAACDRTVQDATKRVRLPGFRKGKAPKNLIEKSLNPSALIDQAAQDLISTLYPQIIKEAQIDPVDYPKVEIKKLEENMPLEFTLEVIVYPKVKLGKYKGLNVQKKTEAEGALKNQLLDEATKTMEADIPEAMISQETEVMLEELKTSLARSNLTLEGYMNALKKTEEDLRGEFRQSALTRVKGKVALKAIAAAEKLEPTEAEIDQEIKLMAQDTGKDPEEFKKSLRSSATEYIKDYLSRRKALDFLVEHARPQTP